LTPAKTLKLPTNSSEPPPNHKIDGITKGIRYSFIVINTVDPEFFKNSSEVDSAVADEILPNFL